MKILTTNKDYRDNHKVIYCEPSFYKSYNSIIDENPQVEYRYFLDQELTLEQVIEMLKTSNEAIFFDAVELLEKFYCDEIKDNVIVADLVNQKPTRHQANLLLNHVDAYAQINKIKPENKYQKREDKQTHEVEDIGKKTTLKFCLLDTKETSGKLEVIFAIDTLYDLNHFQIINNGKPVAYHEHLKANNLNTEPNFKMYSFTIDATKKATIKAKYFNTVLLCDKVRNVKRNKKQVYRLENKRYMYIMYDSIQFFPRVGIIEKAIKEAKYILRTRDRQMAYDRFKIFASRVFIRRNKILIADRVMYARDNGEEFYRYLMNRGVRNIYYILNENSPDYQRLSDEGFNILKYGSLKHMLYLYNYKLFCTSNMAVARYHYFKPNEYSKYADLKVGKNIFLQHGVAYNDLSKVYSEYRINIDEFVCSAKRELEFLTKLDFRDNLLYTGAPRFDRLHKETNGNYILAFFTWRENYSTMAGDQLFESFTDTDYFNCISNLINDPRIVAKLAESGMELKLFLHPNMQSQGVYFKETTNHMVCNGENSDISDLIATAKMLITDYSSVACDVAYQHKPVISYQFDKDTFHYETGIDLEKEQLYKAYENHEDAVLAIINLIDNQFAITAEQQASINDFFGYTDNKNNERLYKYLKKKYL